MQRVSECRRSFSHAGTLDGITAESIARACVRAMSITARNHIRRRAANAIRMKYEIPSAKIFTTLRIRRVEARPLRGKRRKNFPSGTRRHKAIRRSNKRVNNRAVVAARAAHSASLFLLLFPYLSIFISFSFSPSLSPPCSPLSIFLARSLPLSRFSFWILSLSPFRCSNRTSIKRSPFFNHKCIKCRDQFSPHDRALFVCRRRFNLLPSARFDSSRLPPPSPLSLLLSLSPYFSFLFSLSFSLLFPFFGSRRDYIVLRITRFADEAISAF